MREPEFGACWEMREPEMRASLKRERRELWEAKKENR